MRQWYALYTCPRREKAVARALIRHQIEVFVPLRPIRSRWKDRTKLVQFPLFAGYLFVYIELSQKGEVVRTAGVVSLVGVHGVLTPIPAEQIAALQTICLTQRPYGPSPYRPEGERIRVVQGPLAGLTGMVSEQAGRHYLIVPIDLLQQSVAMALHPDHAVPHAIAAINAIDATDAIDAMTQQTQ